MLSAASARRGCVRAREGDTRGGFGRASSSTRRPRPVAARAAASAASSASAPAPSWGAPGERRDVAGDGSIRVSEACVSAECWASTRALDERVAHDRLSAAVECDVNFVDAGLPPDFVGGDARFARWLRRRGGRREDLVLGGHLPRGAFATRESSLDRSAVAFGDDRAERTAVAVDPKRAYRSVDDAIDRLLLSTGAEWIDVLHVPWLDGVAPDALRGRRSHERITFNGIRGEIDDGSSEDHAYNNKRVVNVFEEPFTTAMDALRWVPLDSYSSSASAGFSKRGSANVASNVASFSSFVRDAFVPERLANPSTLSADARHSAVREAHRRALSDAVRSGKVRKLCVSFETPWDACGLELGAAAFFEPRELADGFSVARRNENGSLGDAVAGVSLSLSALRDPRLFRRRDDYEATLARWCAPPGVQETVCPSTAEENAFTAESLRVGKTFPVVAARGVFFPDVSNDVSNGGESRLLRLLAEDMVLAASAFGAFTREDVALGLARARGYAASVAMGAVSSRDSDAAMDDATFARRLAAFAMTGGRGGRDGGNMHLDAACLAAVDAARLKHFKGASNAERGRGKGRGRGRDPFEELNEDEEER